MIGERPLTNQEISVIALDVAKALNYLHCKQPSPIIHRDVSSANVLLWQRGVTWRAKLSDYGAANFMSQSRTVNPGAPPYSAPEARSGNQTPKVHNKYNTMSILLQCILDYPYLDYPNLDYTNTKLGRKQSSIPSYIRRIFKTDEVFFSLTFEFC